MARELLHAGFVAEDAAPADAAAGIDRQYRHPVPQLQQVHSQCFDQGALTRPRHPGDADADGAAAMGEHRAEHLLGLDDMGFGIAFDQGDRPPEHGPVAIQDTGDICLAAERFAAHFRME